MPLFKIQASYKPTAEIDTFIGDQGGLFYSEDERILRISDGVTPGGITIGQPATVAPAFLLIDGGSSETVFEDYVLRLDFGSRGSEL